MTNKLLLIFTIFALSIFGCGKKKEEPKKVVKREVVKPAEPKKDSVTVAPEPEPVEVKLPDNKYFLIAASFTKEANAVAFKDELIKQGFDAEVIVRESGVNPEFYKVSYKGFYDREEAYEQLAYEKQQPGNENVWLMVKK